MKKVRSTQDRQLRTALKRHVCSLRAEGNHRGARLLAEDRKTLASINKTLPVLLLYLVMLRRLGAEMSEQWFYEKDGITVGPSTLGTLTAYLVRHPSRKRFMYGNGTSPTGERRARFLS